MTRLITRHRTPPNKFEDAFLQILWQLGIKAFHDHGQMELQDLRLLSRTGQHMEFDIVGVIGQVGIIFEVTREADHNLKKMKRFYKNCLRFVQESPLTPDKKIKLLKGIPRKERRHFRRIGEWRFVYVSDRNEIYEKNYDEKEVTNDENFVVLNKFHFKYIKFLSKYLGVSGKYEFLNKLKITFEKANITVGQYPYDAIKTPSRKISSKMGYVDLYLFSAPVSDLLRMCRVSRYDTLENWRPELGTESFQRILSDKKLDEIRDFICKVKEESSFPNTVTVVINGDLDYRNGKLRLNTEYGSLDVIDGQHRLFAFANSGLTDDELEQTMLLLTGIKFTGDISPQQIKVWNARTFVEINSSQTKVSTDLIYLLRYGVMKEILSEGLSTEAIKRLNINKKSKLYDLFKTSSLSGMNRLGVAPIKFVTIANELRPLFPTTKRNKDISRTQAEQILKSRTRMVDDYFDDVAEVFDEDWEQGARNSLIFTTNYITAFCAILVKGKKRRLSRNKIKGKLNKLKNKLSSSLKNYDQTNQDKSDMKGPNGELFWRDNPILPRPQNLSSVKELIVMKAGFRIR